MNISKALLEKRDRNAFDGGFHAGLEAARDIVLEHGPEFDMAPVIEALDKAIEDARPK